MKLALRVLKKLCDPAVAIVVAAGYVVLLLSTTDDLGYARDEGFYFVSARTYGKWFELLATSPHEALAPATVDKFWSVNSEHPALMKSLFALSNQYLQEKHHFFSMTGTSFRFPAMVLSGLLLGVVYLWARRLHGRLAGLVAALSLGFFPRVFFNAHLACFDAPIMALFAITAFSYVESLRKGGVVLPLVTGVAFGLALDTKHNAWFLPIAGVAHLVGTAALALVLRAPLWPATKRILANLAAMGVLGPLVFYALWPWIWHDTSARLHAYVQFHVGHEYYNMEFLGENYWQPPMPRAYAWVMTLGTVPGIALLLFGVGVVHHVLRAVRVVRRRDAAAIDSLRETLFVGLCLGACYAPWLSTNTPIFGGTKHWLPAYPFLVLFAATGFSRVRRGLVQLAAHVRSRKSPRLVPGAGLALGVALAVVAVAAPMREALHSHPWGLSAYTPLVGGAPGAATLGLNRTFWGYTTGSVEGDLNRDVRPGGTVYIHDTAWQSWQMFQEDGRIRKDIVAVGAVEESEAALYHHEMHMEGQEYQAWVAYGTDAPAMIAGLDGVPVVWVYERPRR